MQANELLDLLPPAMQLQIMIEVAASKHAERARALYAVFESLAIQVGIEAALKYCRYNLTYVEYAQLSNAIEEELQFNNVRPTKESEAFVNEVV